MQDERDAIPLHNVQTHLGAITEPQTGTRRVHTIASPAAEYRHEHSPSDHTSNNSQTRPQLGETDSSPIGTGFSAHARREIKGRKSSTVLEVGISFGTRSRSGSNMPSRMPSQELGVRPEAHTFSSAPAIIGQASTDDYLTSNNILSPINYDAPEDGASAAPDTPMT